MRVFRNASLAVLTSCGLLACGGEGADLELRDARLPAPAGDRAAVYLTVSDRGGTGDRLVGAESEAAQEAMLHETRHSEGRTSMAPVEAFPVPPGGELVLRPGGGHVMLHGLRRALAAGDEVPLELVFEEAGRVRLEVPVVDPADALRE